MVLPFICDSIPGACSEEIDRVLIDTRFTIERRFWFVSLSKADARTLTVTCNSRQRCRLVNRQIWRSMQSLTFRLSSVGFLVLIGLIAGLFLGIPQVAQTEQTQVRYLVGKEPVSLVSFKVKDENFRFGQRLALSKGWLRDFSVLIRNESGKAVTYIDVGVFVKRPEHQTDQPPFHFSIIQGNKKSSLRREKSGLFFESSNDKDDLLLLMFQQEEFDSIQSSLSALGYSETYDIELQIEEVGFSDGTLWSVGGWYRTAPGDPDRLLRIRESKGSEQKVAAFQLSEGEQCVLPIYSGKRCGTGSCEARNVGQTDVNEQTHLVRQGYERCYIINPDGSRGDYCGQDILVNLPVTCPPPPDNSCSEYGEGWFIGIDGRTCVPPECADCYAAGGSNCPPCWTPILIDMNGNGFSMTSGANGVAFRPAPDIDPIQTAWTSAGTDDAWLVLDRNGNSSIDDASELFSCAAPQPQPLPGQIGNGFIALAEFDKPNNGGNGDNQIDRHDSVFSRLQLWNDGNKNGISEQRELERLAISEVRLIELSYEESRRVDQYGNKFKYRALVRNRNGAQLGRWAYDVFPVVQY